MDLGTRPAPFYPATQTAVFCLGLGCVTLQYIKLVPALKTSRTPVILVSMALSRPQCFNVSFPGRFCCAGSVTLSTCVSAEVMATCSLITLSTEKMHSTLSSDFPLTQPGYKLLPAEACGFFLTSTQTLLHNRGTSRVILEAGMLTFVC